MGRLRDKVILITGGAGAVGSAVAEAVVRNGGIAVDTDLGSREGIDHVLDVTSETDWQRVIGAVEKSAGRLDGLVNAAGIAEMGTDRRHRLREVPPHHGDQCRRHVPRLQIRHSALMKRTGGSIVNISSVSGLVGGHNLCRLQCLEGRRAAAVEVRRAARRAAQPAGALQFGASDLPRRRR